MVVSVSAKPGGADEYSDKDGGTGGGLRAVGQCVVDHSEKSTTILGFLSA